MSKRLKIGILGSKGTTVDLIEALAADPHAEIAAVFLLNDRSAARNSVAFFEGSLIRESCERLSLPIVEIATYTLTDEADLSSIRKADLDILCVLGWERLLPDAVLTLPRHFTCGMHGSPYGLPRGRGRSPMNWSIITGQRHFTTSLFRYSPGVDDGDIIASRTFDINVHDTIQTLHHKNRWVMQSLLAQAFRDLAQGRVTFTPQPSGEPSFYPKRTPEDGGVDWSESTTAIHRLVRAVAPPYPGAYCEFEGQLLRIEAAQPFDTALFAAAIPAGTIVDISCSGAQFVVKTVDGSLLVTRFSGVALSSLRVGARLDGVDRATMMAALAERYGPNVPLAQWEVTADSLR